MANSGGANPSAAVRALALFATVYLSIALFYAGQAALFDPSGGPERIPLIGSSLLFAATAMALAARLSSAWALLVVILGGFAAQIAWAQWIDAQPFGSFGALWDSARRLAVDPRPETLFASPSPMAVAFYATVVRVFGPELDAVRGAAAGLWALQTGLVWLIARQIREVKSGALAAAAAVGLTPAAAAYGALPSDEAVFAPLALAGVYLVLSHRNRGLWVSAALAGVMLGLAMLTMPTALAFAAPIALVLATAVLAARRIATLGVLVVGLLAFFVGATAVLGPVLNAQANRDASMVAKVAPTFGFDLMFGANRASGGAYAVSDLEQIGYAGPEGLRKPFAEAERAARALAWERIAEAPIGFVWFAGTEKMRRLWSSEAPLLSWTVDAPSPRRDELAALDVKRRAGAVIDGAYLAVLALALMGSIALAARGAVRDPSRWLVVLGAFAALCFMRAFMAVEAGQHLTFLPLLAMLCAYALTPQPRAARMAAQGEDEPSPMVELSREQKLAGVLAQMSKPPRPDDKNGGGAQGGGSAGGGGAGGGRTRSGGQARSAAPFQATGAAEGGPQRDASERPRPKEVVAPR